MVVKASEAVKEAFVRSEEARRALILSACDEDRSASQEADSELRLAVEILKVRF
jgi:hypothetical protein